jgi:hypothetical protein
MTKKPKESIFGRNWMAKGRKQQRNQKKTSSDVTDGERQKLQRNQKKVSSDTIGWWKVETDKETKRKYLRTRSDGGRLKPTKKPKESIFGHNQMVKGQNQQSNQKKVSSDTIRW